MVLKPHHKRAARYFLVGMTPKEVAERLRVYTEKQVKLWRVDLVFKKYMVQLQAKYLRALDADIEQLRRTAIARLQSIIELEDTNSSHFEWAINKAFAITLLKERTVNVNNAISVNDPKPLETPEQKRALKEFLRLSGDDAQRYTSHTDVTIN